MLGLNFMDMTRYFEEGVGKEEGHVCKSSALDLIDVSVFVKTKKEGRCSPLPFEGQLTGNVVPIVSQLEVVGHPKNLRVASVPLSCQPDATPNDGLTSYPRSRNEDR